MGEMGFNQFKYYFNERHDHMGVNLQNWNFKGAWC